MLSPVQGDIISKQGKWLNENRRDVKGRSRDWRIRGFGERCGEGGRESKRVSGLSS